MRSTFRQLHIAAMVLGAVVLAAIVVSNPTRAGLPPLNAAGKMHSFVDSHTLAGGVILVTSKEKVLSFDAFGFADIAANKPMKTDAVFWIASMSKPITAAALMMLVDEGRVSVDDPVEKFLPEFKGQMVIAEKDDDHVLLKKPAHPMTVKNLLTHTSGLTRSPLESHIDSMGLRENVQSCALLPLKFEPGSKYEYSVGINVAGRIVEVVSGMKFDEFLDQRLFKPLGMRDTTFWPSESQLQRLAKSYSPNKTMTFPDEVPIKPLTYPLSNRSRGVCPGGGLFSTASDIGAFGRMLLNGGTFDGKRILSEAAVKQMSSTQTGDLLINGKDDMGYGFGISTVRKVRSERDPMGTGSFGHGGAYGTYLWLDPRRQLVMVLMIQHATFPGPERDTIRPAFLKAVMEDFDR